MSLPPLHSFKVFESVARLGSLSAAAVELHVSTGAVSQQLKALQVNLGTELFSKSGRQLIPTSGGRQLQKRVANAISEIIDAVNELRINQEKEIFEITVSIPPVEGTEWLVNPMLRFMAESRSTRLSVITAATMAQVEWSRADIAVIYGSPPWPGYWWRVLHSIRMTPVCSPQYLLDSPAIYEGRDLAQHRLLHEDDGCNWRKWLAEAGLGRGGLENIHFEDFGMVLQAAREGIGVALSDAVVSARDLGEGKLVCPLPISVPAMHNYYVVCNTSTRERPEIRAFMDWLLTSAGQPR